MGNFAAIGALVRKAALMGRRAGHGLGRQAEAEAAKMEADRLGEEQEQEQEQEQARISEAEREAHVRFLAGELSIAARNCNPGHLARMLAEGADPNALDRMGLSPMMHVAMRGSVECVRLLLGRARPGLRSSEGDTALGIAVKVCSKPELLEIASLLGPGEAQEADGRGRTPLMEAAGDGWGDLAKALLRWSDPMAEDAEGLDALMLAAGSGSREAVEALLPVSAWWRGVGGLGAADLAQKEHPELARWIRGWALAAWERAEIAKSSGEEAAMEAPKPKPGMRL